jgi:NADH-quinone oxidoreductase subunit M
LNGFVGEFLILVGTFQSEGVVLQATSTSQLAWLGIIAANLAALGAVVLLGLSLARQNNDQIGLLTKIVTVAGALLLAGVLVFPPMGGLAGGLLIRPLVSATAQSESFREIFALLAVLAGTGVIFAAVYLLLATQRVFFGPIRHAENEKLKDLTLREGLVLAPLVLAAVLIGVYPKPFLDAINPTVASYANTFRARAGLPSMQTAQVRPALRSPGATPARLAPGALPMRPPLQIERRRGDAAAVPKLDIERRWHKSLQRRGKKMEQSGGRR